MAGSTGIRDAGRVLVAELDSIEQLRIYESAASRADAQRTLLGMIRTAGLLAERVVVTDSMLLDGVLFLDLGPQQLAACLGVAIHDLPFTVLSRSGALRSALEVKLATPGFVWQTASSDALRDGAGTWPYERVTRAWEDWIRAAENGDLTFEIDVGATGGGSPPFAEQMEARLAVAGPPVRAAPAQALVAETRSVVTRSAFVRRFDSALIEHPIVREELESVRAWWNDAYLDVLAARNRASWLRFSEREDAAPLVASPDGSRRQLGVTGTMLATMTSVPPPVYGTIRYSLRSERADFVSHASARSLSAIAYGVSAHLGHPGRGTVVRGAVARLVIAVIAVFVGVVPLEGSFLDLDLAWVAVAVVALVTIPWPEFTRLYGLSQRALVGVVSVRADL